MDKNTLEIDINESVYNMNESVYNINESIYNMNESIYNINESIYNINDFEIVSPIIIHPKEIISISRFADINVNEQVINPQIIYITTPVIENSILKKIYNLIKNQYNNNYIISLFMLFIFLSFLILLVFFIIAIIVTF
jgi:hypothetical protein